MSVKIGDLKIGDVIVRSDYGRDYPQMVSLILQIIDGHIYMVDLEDGRYWSSFSEVNNFVTGWDVYRGGSVL